MGDLLPWIVLGLALIGGEGSTSYDTIGELGPGDAEGRAELVALCGEMGIADDWRDYLLMHARGESGFRTRVARGVELGAPSDVRVTYSEQEAERSGVSYDRNARQLFAGSPWTRDRYVFGTGGWFQQIPTIGLAAFRDSPLLPDADPWLVFDPRASIVMILAAADRLMRDRAFVDDPRFLRVRGGFRNLATMRDSATLASRRPYYERAARGADVDPAILDARPSPLPTTNWPAWISFNPWGGA